LSGSEIVLLIRLGEDLMISIVLSFEAPSIMMCSISGKVWLFTEEIQLAMVESLLKVGVMIFLLQMMLLRKSFLHLKRMISMLYMVIPVSLIRKTSIR